jgi:two-component system, chemotaxis family, chemotaxis protein CheY
MTTAKHTQPIKRILFVDDDPLYIDLVREVFASQKLSVVSTPDAPTALTLLASTSFDLIVSDVDMPVMDGLDFHVKVREDEKHKNTVFVFLTGSNDPALARYAKKHPNTRLIHKTDLVNELMLLISELR